MQTPNSSEPDRRRTCVPRDLAHRVSWRTLWWLIAGLIAVAIGIVLPTHPPRTIVSRTPADLVKEANSSVGFFPPEIDGASREYVWTQPHATIWFADVGRRPFDLLLSLRSAAAAGGPDAPIHILIDGVEIAQVRPDPTNAAFQTFRVPVASVKGGELKVRLQAEPYRPAGDGRTLGAIVQRIAIDQSGSWSAVVRRWYLYGVLPLLSVIAIASVALAWRAQAASLVARSCVAWLRALAIAVCCIGAVSMLAAVAILLRMGRIDAYRYPLWLCGSVYLAGFFGAVALHLPIGATGARNLRSAVRHTALMQRRSTAIVAVAHAACFGLTALLALRLLASPGTGDVDDKLRWMHNIAAHGLVGGFQVSKDNYPPGTYIVLAVLTKIAPHLGIGSFLAYKLSIFAFLLLSGLIAWRWTRNAPFAIVLQLGLIVDSMIMGYNDVYFVAPLLLALWALRSRRMVWFAVLFTLACLMKWQPLVLAPVLLIYAVATMARPEHRRRDVTRLACAVAVPSAAILITTLAIFGPEFLAEFRRATSENFLSANALNFQWIVTEALAHLDPRRFAFGAGTSRQYIRVPSATLLALIKLLFLAIYLGILSRFVRRPMTYTTMLYYAYLGYIAYFLFNTSVHENHHVPAVVLAGLLWAMDRRYGPLFLVTTVMMNVNLLLFYGLDGLPRLPILLRGLDVSLPLAILDVALFGLLLVFGHRFAVVSGGPDEQSAARVHA